jgi:predicted metal-dependent hydrolase
MTRSHVSPDFSFERIVMSTNKLEIRNPRFALDDKIPRYWHGDRRSVTTFLNSLSILFPVGERFFIHSVKLHLDYVQDEQLRKDVRAFMGQEGVHGREHEAYNEMLTRQGYPIKRLEGETRWLLNKVKRFTYKRAQLAATAGFEHFTAILANAVLKYPDLFKDAHPVMAAMWRWHAAEESEHKAVAYDVYTLAGGNYAERSFVMLLVSAGFLAKAMQHQAVLMKHDGMLYNAKEWRALYRFAFQEPGGLREVFGDWLAYFRPGFHPWDMDNNALLEEWKKEYAKLPEYKRAS